MDNEAYKNYRNSEIYEMKKEGELSFREGDSYSLEDVFNEIPEGDSEIADEFLYTYDLQREVGLAYKQFGFWKTIRIIIRELCRQINK